MKNQNHTSHLALRTSQKGITLIALIITIIVMLILVGVTINVALNGGLFTKAETATRETEEKAILEEMLAMMEITKEEKINYTAIITKMKEKYGEEKVKYNYPNATITGKLGTYNYIVSETEIKIGSANQEELEVMKTYFLGAIDETTGKRPGGINLVSLVANPEILGDLSDPTQVKFKDNDIISDAYDNMSVISVGDEGEGHYAYVTYKGMIYKVIVSSDFVTDDVTVEIENAGVALGKYVQYDGKLWRVLYNEGEYGEGAQLISADTLEVDSVYLGYNDSIVNWSDEEVIAEANKFSTDNPSETEVLSNVEKAIYSYNHAIENLNTKCASLITDNSKITAVRSVGSNPSSPNSEEGNCSLEILKSLPVSHTAYPAGSFNGIAKNTDENYLTDYERMEILGISKSDNSEYYWLASRLVNETANKVSINIRCTDSGGQLSSCILWSVFHIYANNAESKYEGVRPVISLKPGVLKEAIESDSTKDGSLLNPYVIK